MQIIAIKKTESVVLTLQSGDEFEVTMIQVYGDDSKLSTNISQAVQVFNNIVGADNMPSLDHKIQQV